ncbi:hypothetical protein Tco_1216794 [Tanacetum coccineum]
MKDKVVQNNSQVKIKKKEVEDHHRISIFSNKTKFVTACNYSLKSKTLNVNVVCVTCDECVFNSNHDAFVSMFINDVNARTKKPQVVPFSTRKPKIHANQFVATPHRKTVASESTIQKFGSYFRMLYENTNCTNHPIHRILWMHKAQDGKPQVAVKCHDQEGLLRRRPHNLFFVGQFYDADLEVAFIKSTCFVRDLQGNDILMGTRRSDLYTIALQESSSPTLICFMAKATPTQAWL